MRPSPTPRAQPNVQKDTPLTFDDLSPTEQTVALIGEHPDALRPISFMNTSHYVSLLKSNAIAGSLTQAIEAYKTVSAQ